ncbi:transposase [Microvirga lotononidis]|uniref:Tc1-like transposase DDE domain-containing protein n=1 Tax=Microvirga lotononidis TaxID=864069 RepID=I4YRB7_9HYPH|nr:transposase [Microvirga lotononidis]EIM26509.1 hypothetical protein MicloDRAFT_00030580 [Microvirga lotononidis]WQO31193.1 transposase [Microvirga lotononidis]
MVAQVGLTRTGVFDICRGFAEQGLTGLVRGPRGPASGTSRFLEVEQEAQIRALIRRHTPEQLGLPFALWSRAAVQMLIERHCSVGLAVRTISTYLARGGFTAQNGKVFLIWDNLPVPRARARQDWLAEHTEQIEAFYLPPFSREPDPDEGLNADLKQAATASRPLAASPNSNALSSARCVGSPSCPTGSAATLGIHPSVMPRSSRSPEPDQ